MKTTVSRDIPLAEITLRKYEKPTDLDQRELVKKLCLSIGLLQPGDSRDVIVDVLTIFFSKSNLTSEQVRELVIAQRKEKNLPLRGIASSNIRRQLKRLKDLFLIENVNNLYRMNENETLPNIFEQKIENFYIKGIMDRVREYFNAIKK